MEKITGAKERHPATRLALAPAALLQVRIKGAHKKMPRLAPWHQVLPDCSGKRP